MTLNGCSKKLCPMQKGTVDNCNLTKEQCPYFTQDIDLQNLHEQFKAEVAREIFEEIDALFVRFYDDPSYSSGELGYDIAELKKKYTQN